MAQMWKESPGSDAPIYANPSIYGYFPMGRFPQPGDADFIGPLQPGFMGQGYNMDPGSQNSGGGGISFPLGGGGGGYGAGAGFGVGPELGLSTTVTGAMPAAEVAALATKWGIPIELATILAGGMLGGSALGASGDIPTDPAATDPDGGLPDWLKNVPDWLEKLLKGLLLAGALTPGGDDDGGGAGTGFHGGEVVGGGSGEAGGIGTIGYGGMRGGGNFVGWNPGRGQQLLGGGGAVGGGGGGTGDMIATLFAGRK